VNAGSFPDEEWNSMASYYPGDDYVDWIGISVYGPQSRKQARQYWETFTDLMDEYYPELAALSSDKPLAVVEFGVTE
jgi:beta-mannanase